MQLLKNFIFNLIREILSKKNEVACFGKAAHK